MAREKLGEIELAVLDKIRARLEQGQSQYGAFQISDPRNFPKEAAEELFDASVYMAVQLERLKDIDERAWWNRYSDEVKRTSSAEGSLVMGALGRAGESGEFVDLVKKQEFHGHEITVGKYVDELGDVLWYVQYLCNRLGISLAVLAANNTSKLRQRYPEGFDTERSKNRG